MIKLWDMTGRCNRSHNFEVPMGPYQGSLLQSPFWIGVQVLLVDPIVSLPSHNVKRSVGAVSNIFCLWI